MNAAIEAAEDYNCFDENHTCANCDSWMTDDTVDFYYERVRRATPEEIELA